MAYDVRNYATPRNNMKIDPSISGNSLLITFYELATPVGKGLSQFIL